MYCKQGACRDPVDAANVRLVLERLYVTVRCLASPLQPATVRGVVRSNHPLSRAWYLKEDFQRFWDYLREGWARRHLDQWLWACDKRHYNTMFRPSQLPSVSQFCRRVKTDRVQAMLGALHDYLTRRETAVPL
ncbi:MAG: transposase [Planctomycetes bacterium]|nr:transposase [Planctomycetota bacterium]